MTSVYYFHVIDPIHQNSSTCVLPLILHSYCCISCFIDITSYSLTMTFSVSQLNILNRLSFKIMFCFCCTIWMPHVNKNSKKKVQLFLPRVFTPFIQRQFIIIHMKKKNNFNEQVLVANLKHAACSIIQDTILLRVVLFSHSNVFLHFICKFVCHFLPNSSVSHSSILSFHHHNC